MTDEQLETLSALVSGLFLGITVFIGAIVALIGPAHVPGFALLPNWLQAGLTHTTLISGATPPPVYWYISRAAGLLAYAALWGSTAWGLIISSKIVDALIPRPISFGLHQFMSTLALVLTGAHIFSLLGDSYFAFTLDKLLVPGRSPYEPFWVSVGVIAFYLLLVVYWSFYVRKRIGYRGWRRLHYLSFGLYVFVTAHGLMAGTDLNNASIAIPYLSSAGLVLFLTYYRILTAGRRTNRKKKSPQRTAPAHTHAPAQSVSGT